MTGGAETAELARERLGPARWWTPRWWTGRAIRVASAIASLPPALRVVLVLAAVLHGVGLSWGLPASDAWDNDGVAPRDVLPGLAATFTPGDYYTYPPVHLALIALLTFPVTVIAVVRAGSTHVPDVIREIIAPPYMTAFALAARIVALLMSLGIAVALAKIAEEICAHDEARARRVATFTAAIASAGVCCTYYSRTSNLDIPVFFWGSLVALDLVRTIARQEPERLRRAAVLAAIAIATKDQAYALFLVSAPLLLGSWAALDPWPTANAANTRRVVREALIAIAIGAVLVAVLDGAVFNPSGFRARLAFLGGPASQDFSAYASDLRGRLAIFADLGERLRMHYPPIFGGVIFAGLIIAVQAARRASRRRLIVALAPLAFALSFTLAFNVAARRTDDRFTLPQAFFAAIYAGFALERLWSAFSHRGLSLLSRAACAFLVGEAVWEAMRVDLTQIYEPRYATEAFLAEKVAPGDTIEVHGLNVYLPRFPSNAHVVRVGQHRRHGPLPGVEEVEAPLMDIDRRRPRFVVISICYAWRFLEHNTGPHDGRIYPSSQLRETQDADATTFFDGMYTERLGYRIVHDRKIPADTWFRPIEIHASLNCRTTTFELALATASTRTD